MSSKVDQKKYLKKYLSGDKSKKRRKRVENHSKTRVTVVDDDIGFTNRDNTDDYNDFYLTGEDAPQVVGIIDDRPPELRAIEDFQGSAKWKSLSLENDDRQFQSDETSYKRSEIKYSNSKNYKNDQQNLLRRSQNSDSSSDLSPKRKLNLKAKYDYHNSIRSTGQKFERSLLPSRKPANKDYYNPSKERIDKDLSPQRRKLPLQKFAKPNNEDDKFPLRRKSKNFKSSEENVSLTKKRTIDENVIAKDMDKSSTSYHPSHCLNATPSPNNTCKTSPKQTGVKRTLDGKLAGLQTAANLREEVIETRRQNDDFFENMPTEVSGKNADIVVRSTQRTRSKNRDKNKQKELEKKQHEIEKKEKYSRWGKGLKQIKLYQHKMADELHESSKPLARYSNDVDLDKMLKQQERLDDPMLVYMRQKRNTVKSAGMEVPVYKGCFPENRFNIRPGYRWDGVDRSNGYEKKLFDIQNQKKAIQEEAYKYSTEDM